MNIQNFESRTPRQFRHGPTRTDLSLRPVGGAGRNELKVAALTVTLHPNCPAEILLSIDEFIDNLNKGIDVIKSKVASSPDAG